MRLHENEYGVDTNTDQPLQYTLLATGRISLTHLTVTSQIDESLNLPMRTPRAVQRAYEVREVVHFGSLERAVAGIPGRARVVRHGLLFLFPLPQVSQRRMGLPFVSLDSVSL